MMIEPLELVNYGTRTLALLTTGALVAMLWRRREEPTAGPLLWMAGALFVYAVIESHILTTGIIESGLLTSSSRLAAALIVLAVVGGVVILLIIATGWFLFALEYTGRTDHPESTVKVLLSIQLVVLFVLVANQLQPTVPQTAVQRLTLAVSVSVWAELFGSSLLLISATVRQAALPSRQGALLAASPFLFALPIVIATAILTRFPFNATVGSVQLLPIGLTLSATCLLLALSRYRVFETLPVATRTGREQVVESVSRAVVVLDRQQRIHDCNPLAKKHLGIDRSESLREPIATAQPVVPDLNRLVTVEEPVRVQTPDGSLLLLAATEVRNERDQLVGYVLTTRDVTRRYNREQRLKVLNQLLADVTHDRMETVAREVTALADGNQSTGDNDDVGDQIWETTTELATLVARTREIEETLASSSERKRSDRTDVTEAIQTVIADLDGKETDLVTRFPDDRLPTTIDETLVDIAARALLEDAIKAPATVALEVLSDVPEIVEVRIDVRSDPYAAPAPSPDHLGELPIEVARLAIDSVGGSVTVETTDRTQTVHMQLPTGDEGPLHLDGETGQEQVVRP